MDPRYNSHRGWRDRQLRRSRKLPKEANQMNENVEPKKSRKWLWWLLIPAVSILCLLLAFGIFQPRATQTIGIIPLETEIVTTPTESPTDAPTTIPTEAATATPTTAPANTPTEVAPVPTSCNTPNIQASLDGQTWTEQSEYLDTVLGKRMTFTNRKIVVPSKAWNDPLTAAELKLVETTWVSMKVCVPEGMFGRVFAGGFEQSANRYESGAILTLTPGLYEFSLRNGEVTIWYPNQENFAATDLDRIIAQIRVGNFDIHAPLEVLGVTADLLPNIPTDLVSERNVQIVPFPVAK